jgi:hypothetical protein
MPAVRAMRARNYSLNITLRPMRRFWLDCSNEIRECSRASIL